jgi:hypothetical protein
MAYTITLDSDDVDAIEFSSYRYGWSDFLQQEGLDTVGVHNIPEHIAWEMRESWVDNGLEFSVPLLSNDSNLMHEFIRLDSEIV